MIRRKGILKRKVAGGIFLRLIDEESKKTANRFGVPRRINRKASRMPVGARKPTGVAKVRKRRKKGEITKLKEKLWELCRIITRHKYGNRCYTCGKGPLTGSSYQTGHYITSSNCSVELRYDLKNLAIQCYNCNINKSGNWVVFERLLTEKYGPEYVAELKARNLATKGLTYPKEWFLTKIQEYEQKIKEMT